ncbi:prolipoprotein diacylglyceryl transferase [Lysinibacillus sp. 2017]|uniref:prolipoprotein diacylglyceryl transferase n=1 Tax=unclassified Lysinibacillus TaxID=2636778 RepID=UPI000D529E4F|nr:MULTISPECIES: prolipoprotein diacylglyceryl transferase [unclassified Lysinibacillus]AWE08641.1 prolipoprotein diacylglyceryl transferase [Lysinibacillus sp. 2017]TGN35062.1 prolipoprotein diacylglyceryl transferase [Lysinibacillus sp. S2017]
MLGILMAINPVAIHLGSLSVRWYGIMIGAGIVIGYFLAQKESVRRGFHDEFFADLLIWAVPIAILSARVYYVAMKWDFYSQHPGRIIEIWNGGIAIHGALIGSFITAYIFTRKRKVSFLQIADIAAPSILVGQIVGRWGNFMNQEAYGGPVSRGFLENLFLPNWLIEQMYIKEESTYVHPTFLYESLWNVVGLIILLFARKWNWRRGEMFFFYLIWYSFGRFFIEGMRTDSLYLIGDLRSAQVVSILGIAIGIIAIVYRRLNVKPVIHYLDPQPTVSSKKKQQTNKKK